VNRRQKAILAEVATVISVTLIAVVGMINFKDYVNRSEAISAMQQLSRIIADYRSKNGGVPPSSAVMEVKNKLKGGARLAGLCYRGLWIEFDSGPDTILAYAAKRYPASLLSDGYVVLLLDGTVKWEEKEQFEKTLAEQQSDIEIEMSRQ